MLGMSKFYVKLNINTSLFYKILHVTRTNNEIKENLQVYLRKRMEGEVVIPISIIKGQSRLYSRLLLPINLLFVVIGM